MTKSILAAVLLLGACSHTIGSDFDLSEVQTLVPGRSTIIDAESKLGPATQFSVKEDGQTMVRWVFVRVSPGRASRKIVDLRFDRDDKYLGLARSLSQ